MKGQFGPNGALYSGWETRRHNPLPYDWSVHIPLKSSFSLLRYLNILRCIIQLGTTGTISGFDIDTANFNGVLTIILIYCKCLYSFSVRQRGSRSICVRTVRCGTEGTPKWRSKGMITRNFFFGSLLKRDNKWSKLLPKVDLGPSARHLFKIPVTPAFNYVKIHMYPDGGIVSSWSWA